MANPLPELKQLNAIRLRNDWSIRQLQVVMAAAGVRISERTLHYLLMPSTTEHVPYDRTLYKIRMYLQARRSRHKKLLAARKAIKAATA